MNGILYQVTSILCIKLVLIYLFMYWSINSPIAIEQAVPRQEFTCYYSRCSPPLPPLYGQASANHLQALDVSCASPFTRNTPLHSTTIIPTPANYKVKLHSFLPFLYNYLPPLYDDDIFFFFSFSFSIIYSPKVTDHHHHPTNHSPSPGLLTSPRINEEACILIGSRKKKTSDTRQVIPPQRFSICPNNHTKDDRPLFGLFYIHLHHCCHSPLIPRSSQCTL